MIPAAANDWWGWLIWPAVFVFVEIFDVLFSGLETGIYAMNKSRLELHAESSRKPALLMRQWLARPNSLLATLLIGTNLSRYIATFAVSMMFIMAGYQREAEWYTMAVTTPTLFIFSESVPKVVFQRLGSRAVYRTVRLIQAANWLFRVTGALPLILGISSLLMKLIGTPRHTDNALASGSMAAVMAEGQASGVITHMQSIMADRAMKLSGIRLQRIMIPLRRAVTVTAEDSREVLIETIRNHPYSRLPVLNPQRQVVGIVNIYDILTHEGNQAITEALEEPLFLPAGMTVPEALYHMQRRRTMMAVVEEKSKHLGIITIKDLVEEIVGELDAW